METGMFLRRGSWRAGRKEGRTTNDEQQWKAAAEETKKIEDGRWIWVSSTAAGIETEPGEEGGGVMGG